MKTLEELGRIDGALVAFEYAPDGKLVEYRANSEIGSEGAALAAQFCATVTMLFSTLAGAFTRLSDSAWIPQHGWMYCGGDYTVCIGGNRGVFIETAKADFNQLYKALVSEKGREPMRMAA
ncbi:MAG: DUF2173 family protein [Candidatus Sumerlaeota bacterium]|nr:DUF2173 family protein [Candidatus Sumerlaeota bacterium]